MSSTISNPMAGKHVHLASADWHKENGVSVKGSAFRLGTQLDAGALCAAAQIISSESEFISFLKNLNGFFSIIIEKDQKVFAAVDIIRSMPLFYAVENDTLYLSDTAEYIQGRLACGAAGELIRFEFLLTGYVTGGDTLASGLKQLQSGEYLAFQGSRDWQTGRYFSFEPQSSLPNDQAVLREQLNRTCLAAVERLAQWADGRTVVIPLSGGYDSRLLATLLKEIGYDDVLTYTYGEAESAEVVIARTVAKSLGLRCHFVEYTHETWWQWFHSEERKAYFRAAHNLTSIPHIQDWPAVWTLKRDNLIPADAVIVPGHSGDFVAGSHIPKTFREQRHVTKDRFVSEVFDRHYTLWRLPTFEPGLLDALKCRIEAISAFGPVDRRSFEFASSRYEAWDWQERQAKFIVNSVRAYDFWGYQWWLPYFDGEVADFWTRVPFEWRIGCRLYEDYVIDTYARVANLSRDVASRRAPQPRVERMTLARAPYLVARFLYQLVTSERLRRRRRRSLSYNGHPLSIYGIMDRETFERHRGEFRSFHSYISRTVLEGDFF